MPKEFSNLKEKHPDALLLFREGDFYRLYKEDAVKAAMILGIATTDKLTSSIEKKIKTAEFPRTALDTYLPKLIRAGARVAICDRLELVEKVRKNEEPTLSNNTDMAKKSKEKAVQEEPAKTVKNAAGEKPAKKKVETQAEAKSEQKAETKQERKPREPQMVTAAGEKVTHGHAYQSKANPEEWYFTAKMDGKQLKPQRMDAADFAAYQKKEMTVPQLMERYYPTKLMPKVSEESFKMRKSRARLWSIEGVRGNHPKVFPGLFSFARRFLFGEAKRKCRPFPLFPKRERKEWGRKENRAANCCPLTGVTTAVGDTRLVLQAPAGFSIGV